MAAYGGDVASHVFNQSSMFELLLGIRLNARARIRAIFDESLEETVRVSWKKWRR